MVVHVGKLRQDDNMLKLSLGNLARFCLRKRRLGDTAQREILGSMYISTKAKQKSWNVAIYEALRTCEPALPNNAHEDRETGQLWTGHQASSNAYRDLTNRESQQNHSASYLAFLTGRILKILEGLF